jgi:hypothetical protein
VCGGRWGKLPSLNTQLPHKRKERRKRERRERERERERDREKERDMLAWWECVFLVGDQ